MAGGRRKARSIALQALYEIDSVQHDPEETLKNLQAEARLSEENLGFAGNWWTVLSNIKRSWMRKYIGMHPLADRANRLYRPEHFETCNL